MRAKEMTCPTKLLEAKTDPDSRVGTIRALVSVFNNVDHDGDRIVKGAFADTLGEWRAKGDPIPFIWSHDWRNPHSHVGKVDPEAAAETDRGLEVTAQMNLDDPDAAKVYELLADRRVTQFSFAYEVLEWKHTDESTDRGWGGKVTELLKLRLFECGPCLLGANEETDLLEVASRFAKQGRAVSGTNRQKISDAIDLLEQVLSSDDPDDEAARGADGIKSAVGSHSTGTDDGDWDAGAAERNLADDAGAATYRKVYAWQDPDGDPDTQAAWKFPHHLVSSDGAPGSASTKACSAGIAALNGGRGGANIPDADRSGVHAHLAKHLSDADMEAPELNARAGEDEGKQLMVAIESLTAGVLSG